MYHLAEAQALSCWRSLRDLDDTGCVHPQLIGIHSTALGRAELRDWGRVGGAVVWSPLSNIWLYGGTTDVVAEQGRAARLPRLGLGPSGTRTCSAS